MSLLTDVEESMRLWTDLAIKEGKRGDQYKLRDPYLARAANLATIALALRAAQQEAPTHDRP